ncbi:MAG TPA: HEPN domain-containing protein [Candidatus Desulfobacillus denitrificans]|nr:HEPN domain-containing protein [Candidatus Desulfobacillus denitrificans]HNT63287.1 HEPN domain-containing protein [Candidatus Desulfobacillus denitrificans]
MDEKLKLAEAELQLVAENLAAARLVADNRLYRNAVTDLYYAAYHVTVALLAAHGIETASHDGVQTQFGLHFVKTGALDRNAGKFLGNLYHARFTADYKGYVDLDRVDYEEAARQARLVVDAVTGYLAQHFPSLDLNSVRTLSGRL